MERATLRLILSTAILVVFCTYIFIEIGRNPSTVVYVTGTPTGHVVSLQYRDCFDLDTGATIPYDLSVGGCPGNTWDMSLDNNDLLPPNTSLWISPGNQTQIAFSNDSFEQVDLSTVQSLNFSNTFPDIPFVQIAIMQTATGQYYKVQLVSETRNKNRATIQWEQVR
ncbi:MAG: hypothetical protein J0M33_07395 [Anaerolineae bacterium]|nr:hypothetical protein [Anaerolineae bacterium]